MSPFSCRYGLPDFVMTTTEHTERVRKPKKSHATFAKARRIRNSQAFAALRTLRESKIGRHAWTTEHTERFPIAAMNPTFLNRRSNPSDISVLLASHQRFASESETLKSSGRKIEGRNIFPIRIAKLMKFSYPQFSDPKSVRCRQKAG